MDMLGHFHDAIVDAFLVGVIKRFIRSVPEGILLIITFLTRGVLRGSIELLFEEEARTLCRDKYVLGLSPRSLLIDDITAATIDEEYAWYFFLPISSKCSTA